MVSMAPEKKQIKTNTKESKSWKETNKIRKQERKKWKEERAIKKAEKQKLLEAAKLAEQEKQQTPAEPPKELSTMSIAVPGSILENAQSAELRTYLAGQIARAACIFQVDEVVIFDDRNSAATTRKSTIDDVQGTKVSRQCCVQLGRILQYLECPQYLRKHFFPIHNDLKFAGILNPLDAPHHLREQNPFMFREGVVTTKPVKTGKGSLVNVGLKLDAHVDKLLTAGIRCTVKLAPLPEGGKKLKGCVVAPSQPRLETGVYWGYNVRIANSLGQVFSQSPYKNGYDLTIGTSDKGESIDSFDSPTYKHALVVFGGLGGLEAALECDELLNVEDPSLLFDSYLNTVPNQGSRTIRTEEAILVTMAALRSRLNPAEKPIEFAHNEEIAQSSISFPRKFNPTDPNATLVGQAQSGNESASSAVSDDLSRFD